eukprot:NODE_25371_length_589_cov_6.095238.p3 GENE.NODE_25371_length_589_cov_6.095238~~NODE_25371_length_589_cov_6.095238.p3  ORF type:complete len:63 (-),score=3.11 NODE_25371_length_589_cov_6.095238:173-361(-)
MCSEDGNDNGGVHMRHCCSCVHGRHFAAPVAVIAMAQCPLTRRWRLSQALPSATAVRGEGVV